MRRQRKNHQSEDIDINTRQPTNMSYTPLNKESNNMEDFLQMENLTRFNTLEKRPSHRFENTIEAKVEEGDTLQALALRFHCSVADIKRINKIDKDNEIYARKVVKIPVTPHSILLETLPIVHKSGSNSPSQCEDDTLVTNIMKNPLEDARVVLGEKLIVASVNSSSTTSQGTNDINNEIISSKFIRKANAYTEEDSIHGTENDSAALLEDILNDDFAETHVRPIRGPSLSTLLWSGSDGDMTWVCLFIVILALCFAIPLVVVIFWTHPHSSGSNHNNHATTAM
ncbi:lysM and putative peptidoglycan-binding domain-containing protein 4 isoform X1 [Rhagoletis pomonella]|uniref:lysM and putative peptidoglycan-binding domain-containing protein 4 isoform X1 n=1 Tax=Rhagoletis pomonella TaxID=28610 RepID=UPI001786DAFB|nr:lysM and putative peptidoglycan-binding domain-containing protein 4 isoform X1 [Rhagoletis pomonella]